MKKRDISKARLPGLSHHKLSDSVYVVLDLRDPIWIRYVGLVHQIPFGRGFMLCPFVRSGLHFDTNSRIPKAFKTAERAVNWMQERAHAWNSNYLPTTGW